MSDEFGFAYCASGPMVRLLRLQLLPSVFDSITDSDLQGVSSFEPFRGLRSAGSTPTFASKQVLSTFFDICINRYSSIFFFDVSELFTICNIQLYLCPISLEEADFSQRYIKAPTR